MQVILLLTIFVIATCGLIYELVAGTVASYLLGDSVTQFSTIIGTYLFAMGIGSYASRYFYRSLFSKFIEIEILVGIVGGFSSCILFLIFPITQHFSFFLYFIITLTGILVGLEIPILMRLLKDELEFDDLVSKVFSFDYIGALLASLLFPLFFVPQWGLLRTSLFFGILNISIGILLAHKFEKNVPNHRFIKTVGFLFLIGEVITFAFSDSIMRYSEQMILNDPIVYATSSPYQRIAITHKNGDIRLFLNGNLQFSTKDEYRYHEALVHPGMMQVNTPKNILILGGGDGLAAREILRYTSVQKITLVDLDPAMTHLFKTNKRLAALNKGALAKPMVTVINGDAFTWVKKCKELFDYVVIDFPDPSNFSIGKLYSNLFYANLKKILQPTAWVTIQCTSPLAAKRAFWCINTTLASVGFRTFPYHNTVPSFGEWGYISASLNDSFNFNKPLLPHTKFLNEGTLKSMFIFPNDMLVKESLPVNKLNNQSLVDIFEKEWDIYLQ